MTVAQSEVSVRSTRVLKRGDLGAREHDDDRLAQLRREIDAEIATTVDARVAAAEVALRAGQQAARTSALLAVRESLDAAAARLPQELAAVVDRMADELVETAAVLAEWLCAPGGACADTWTAGLTERIVSALGQLTAPETATVRLSPDDAALLTETPQPALSGIEVRPDPTLQPGEALVSTPSGDVDLTLRTALERAVEIVTGRAAAGITDHRDPTKYRRSSDMAAPAGVPPAGRRRGEQP